MCELRVAAGHRECLGLCTDGGTDKVQMKVRRQPRIELCTSDGPLFVVRATLVPAVLYYYYYYYYY